MSLALPVPAQEYEGGGDIEEDERQRGWVRHAGARGMHGPADNGGLGAASHGGIVDEASRRVARGSKGHDGTGSGIRALAVGSLVVVAAVAAAAEGDRPLGIVELLT